MQYIILLRGVNVGGRTIKMAELKSCFESNDFRKVATVLQTGNVILESEENKPAKLRREVEDLLSHTFDYPARVLVLSPEALKAVVENYPFSDHGPEFHRYAVFTEKGFEKELVDQAGKLDKNIEAVAAGEGVVYWRVLKGHTLDSSFGKYIGKAATKNFLTTRNLNTLEKILKKCL